MSDTFYFKGFEVRYTGRSEVVYGAMCYEIEIVEECHRKGHHLWTYRAPAPPPDGILQQIDSAKGKVTQYKE